MSGKIMQRGLVLGVLMAFVITGNVWAQDYAGTNTDNISVGTGTFANTGTVTATGEIKIDGLECTECDHEALTNEEIQQIFDAHANCEDCEHEDIAQEDVKNMF